MKLTDGFTSAPRPPLPTAPFAKNSFLATTAAETQ